MTAVAGQAAENAERGSTNGGEKRPTSRKKVVRGEARFAAFLVAPTVALLAVVVGYPLVLAIVDSFKADSTTAGIDPATGLFRQAGAWVGFDNWTHWLLQRCGTTSCPPGNIGAQFWQATGFTFGLTVIEVSITTLIGLGFALMMNKAFKGRAFVRAVVLVPWAIPTAVTAKLWYVIFQQQGILNHVLGTHINWLTEVWPARAAILIADTWKTAPFMALLILAGLQIIPADLYESAKVDGATAWQRFYKITLPLVKPALVVAVIFRAMDVMRMYDLPAILTQGGSGTTTLSLLVSKDLQQTGPYSSSALSTITFIFIFILALILIKALGADLSQSTKPKKPSRAERRLDKLDKAEKAEATTSSAKV